MASTLVEIPLRVEKAALQEHGSRGWTEGVQFQAKALGLHSALKEGSLTNCQISSWQGNADDNVEGRLLGL